MPCFRKEIPALGEQSCKLRSKSGEEAGERAAAPAEQQGRDREDEQHEQQPYGAEDGLGLAVKELARVERAAHEALGYLLDLRLRNADCALRCGYGLQARVADERGSAREPGGSAEPEGGERERPGKAVVREHGEWHGERE